MRQIRYITQKEVRCKSLFATAVAILLIFSASAYAVTNSVDETLASETNSYWTAIEVDPVVYDSPYRIGLFSPKNGENSARMWSQTKSLGFYGLGAFGVLAVMPTNLTGWDLDADITRRWSKNVRTGPEWDRNNWVYNYIGHTYTGGIYYQVARKSGYRQWDSFIYSFMMSTFYWEYGVEAFAEVPSIQDLAVTPLLGWVFGEWSYQMDRRIRARGGEVAGSKILGNVALGMLDPVDAMGRGLNSIAGRRLITAGHGYFSYNAVPNGNTTDHQVYLNMQVPLGGAKSSEINDLRYADLPDDYLDPVDAGIVGLAVGNGQTRLDKDWDIKNGPYTKVSLGLYFSPRFSSRLAYAWSTLEERATGHSVTYENYSLDGQWYFNSERKFRPYLTAGFGETVWEMENDTASFNWNGGFGIHWQFHSKWAVQTDWIHFYDPSRKTHDQNLSAGIVFRFDDGEHYNW